MLKYENYHNAVCLLFILVICTLFLGVSCITELPTAIDVNPSSVIGKSPSSYAQGTPDEVIVEDMKTHLEGLTRLVPEQHVRGVIYFKSGLSYEEFSRLRSQFNLYPRQKGSSVTLYLKSREATAGVKLTESNLDSAQMADYLIHVYKVSPQHIDMDSSVNVDTAFIYGALGDFWALWTEYPDYVRSIGVTGVDESHFQYWYPLKPDQTFVRQREE